MKYFSLFLAFFLFINISSAQFGISARYSKNSVKEWNNTYQSIANEDLSLFDSGIEIGLNYWFRLKNYRVEFLPEITYTQAETTNLSASVDAISHKLSSISFNANVQIYPLDFEGDCDCPTWSKDGNIVKKGFYWLLSVGLSQYTVATEIPQTLERSIEDVSGLTPRVGAGLGLDIGLGDLLTISPFAIYYLNVGSNAWDNQALAYNSSADLLTDNSASINQLQLGLRFIFRPDYGR